MERYAVVGEIGDLLPNFALMDAHAAVFAKAPGLAFGCAITSVRLTPEN
jgi:hypothetical protein